MTDADDLPDGWAVATLGEVTEKVRQGEPPNTSPTFTYLDIAGVDNAHKTITEPKRLPVKDAPSRARQHVRPGDVLVSMTRPNLNAVAVVPANLTGSIASTGFHVLRPKEVLPEWLFMVVRSTAFVAAMSELVQGALYPAVRPSDIRDFTIPVPPLAEQRRIVAKVEELTAWSRAARAALAEVPTLLEQFRQSVLASAFRGDLTADWREKHPNAEPASVLLNRIRAERRKQWEAKYPKKKYVEPQPVDDSDLPELPAEWCWTTAEEITWIGGGLTKNSTQRAAAREIVPLITVAAVRFRQIDIRGMSQIGLLPEDGDSGELLRDDLLIVEGNGSRDQIGRVALWDESVANARHQNHLIRVRAIDVLPGYLLEWLASPDGRESLAREATTTTGLYNLSLSKVGRIPIPLAPLPEQLEALGAVNRHLDIASLVTANLASARVDVDNLDQSLLAKAFRGELVPQDPTDEPAAALLARIRSGGSATGSVERGRAKFYILLLLRTWNKPLGREMLERGLVLMLNADVRRAILGRSKTTAKRTKKSSTPPQFVSGMDVLLGEMIDDGQLVPGPEAGFFAEGQPSFDFATAPKADLDAVRETAEVIKLLHKDKQQATDADIMSALHGEIYELV